MTYKHTMTINKAWFHAGISGLSPAELIARLKNSVKFEIPTGYQDETGFHFGAKATEKEIKWPVAW
jgi:hypothetical protein